MDKGVIANLNYGKRQNVKLGQSIFQSGYSVFLFTVMSRNDWLAALQQGAGVFLYFGFFAGLTLFKAGIYLYDLISSRNKNLGKIISFIREFLSAIILTTCIVGGFTASVAIAGLTPILFLTSILINVTYNLLIAIQNAYRWYSTKDEMLRTKYKASFYKHLVGVCFAGAAAVLLSLLMIVQFAPAAMAITSACVNAVGFIMGVFAGLKIYLTNKKLEVKKINSEPIKSNMNKVSRTQVNEVKDNIKENTKDGINNNKYNNEVNRRDFFLENPLRNQSDSQMHNLCKSHNEYEHNKIVDRDQNKNIENIPPDFYKKSNVSSNESLKIISESGDLSENDYFYTKNRAGNLWHVSDPKNFLLYEIDNKMKKLHIEIERDKNSFFSQQNKRLAKINALNKLAILINDSAKSIDDFLLLIQDPEFTSFFNNVFQAIMKQKSDTQDIFEAAEVYYSNFHCIRHVVHNV